MNNYKLLIDWTIPAISVFSLLISLITLYLTHLRGANIVVVSKKSSVNAFHELTNYNPKENNIGMYFKTKILFVNTGNQPGIIYDIDIGSNKDFEFKDMEPEANTAFPVFLKPGEQFSVFAVHILTIDFRNKDRYLGDYTNKFIACSYCTNSNLFRNKNKKYKIVIDPFKNILGESNNISSFFTHEEVLEVFNKH